VSKIKADVLLFGLRDVICTRGDHRGPPSWFFLFFFLRSIIDSARAQAPASSSKPNPSQSLSTLRIEKLKIFKNGDVSGLLAVSLE